MNKATFNLFCALIAGLIMTTLAMILHHPFANATAYGLITAIFTFALLLPVVSARLKHICCDLDWAEEIANTYHNIPAVYRKSFWILFALINLAFLFHTINFMWGGNDWAAIRTAVSPTEGLPDGRFSAFWLQKLLFNGKILPVANNLWAFLGLSLAGVLLAIYWNFPQKITPIVLSGLLLSTTPYTLIWLYSAKNTLGALWLPALALLTLVLAELKFMSHNLNCAKNLTSVVTGLLVIGSYPPVINFIAVAIVGKVFLLTTYADISLKDAFLRVRQSLVNITSAIMVYLLILSLLNENGVLANSLSISDTLSAFWANITFTCKSIIDQFAFSFPFIDITYQLLFLALIISAIFTVIFKAPNTKASLRGLALIPLILIAGKLTLFFTTNKADAIEYAAHISFYNLPLTYALMFITLIKLGGNATRRFAYILTTLLIFMSFVRVAYAQKVWKFGWDAETKLAERIITRLEKMPEFDINRQYKLLQIGEMSLRSKYYLKKPYEKANNNLLQHSYYPSGNAKEAYNFFYQTDFLSADAGKEALNEPAIREYIKHQARPYPAKEGLWIYNNYIILILNQNALTALQSTL
ncbi:MAG: hypothetical protein NC218_12085 [Acetobacter sp.]|nr:hypothetical protein [Acetobacter sp.]